MNFFGQTKKAKGKGEGGKIIQLNPGERYIEWIRHTENGWIQIVPVNWTDGEKLWLYVSLKSYADYLDSDYFISPYVGVKEAEA